MTLLGYRLNIDALLARVLYRWHWKIALSALLCGAILGLATGLVPPFWRGAASLSVVAAPGATITVDGRAWPRALYAGAHRVVARLPDGRTSWADVALAAGQALDLSMPPGLGELDARPLPPAAPGMQIASVWWADGGWRVVNTAAPQAASEAEDDPAAIASPVPVASQTVTVSARGLERLATLDAYAGLADQVHIGGALVEAVYLQNERAGYGERAGGSVEIRGWNGGTTQVPITAPLTLLRLSPPGDALLVVEQVAASGEQVSIVRAGGRREAVVAVPGHITRVSWREDGTAAVLHSRMGDRLSLTLVRLQPTIAAAVVADLDTAQPSTDLVPLTWSADGLMWIAPNADGVSTLWRASVAALVPERVHALAARAISYLPDRTLRIVTVQDEAVVIGRVQDGVIVGEGSVPQVTATADLSGEWHEAELLLQGNGRAWLVKTAASDEVQETGNS